MVAVVHSLSNGRNPPQDLIHVLVTGGRGLAASAVQVEVPYILMLGQAEPPSTSSERRISLLRE